MSEVRFSAAAQSDLLDIVVFIAWDNPDAAENWLAAIEERCRLLADHPLTGELRPGFGVEGCRSVSAGAYVIFFRPIQSGVEIARVVHGSRDLGVRIKVFDPNDPAEIALVNQLQDQFVIEAGSADPLPPLRWDLASLKTLTTQYEKDGAAYGSYKGMMGARGKVDEKTRHIAAAAAWGLFPERDATYLNYSGNHDIKVGHKATYKVPDNDAFWSITVYGKDGFMKSENCILNSSNVKLNQDGTFTVYFGSKELCGDVPNRLDVTDGWNFLMRVYRPGASVLDGTYQLPRPESLK